MDHLLFLDASAPLDKDFKVKGVANLRVVDNSVWPEIPGKFHNLVLLQTSYLTVHLLLRNVRHHTHLHDLREGSRCSHGQCQSQELGTALPLNLKSFIITHFCQAGICYYLIARNTVLKFKINTFGLNDCGVVLKRK